jgi:hypothetical protein
VKRTDPAPTVNPTPEVAAFVESLSLAQLRRLGECRLTFEGDGLNFRTWGDRRKAETMRHGLTVCLTRYPNDLARARAILAGMAREATR